MRSCGRQSKEPPAVCAQGYEIYYRVMESTGVSSIVVNTHVYEGAYGDEVRVVVTAARRSGALQRALIGISSAPLPPHWLLLLLALQPKPSDMLPLAEFVTTRRTFNKTYVQWCEQNLLEVKEVRQAPDGPFEMLLGLPAACGATTCVHLCSSTSSGAELTYPALVGCHLLAVLADSWPSPPRCRSGMKGARWRCGLNC